MPTTMMQAAFAADSEHRSCTEFQGEELCESGGGGAGTGGFGGGGSAETAGCTGDEFGNLLCDTARVAGGFGEGQGGGGGGGVGTTCSIDPNTGELVCEKLPGGEGGSKQIQARYN